MDGHGSQGTPLSLPPVSRRSTKGKAPPPPTAKGLDSQRLSVRLLGTPLSAMDQKENLIDKELTLTVVLPGGAEKTTTVPGSKPMMDLLVMLCAKYHLNPSSHTMELISTNRNHIKFKPNALIGALEAEKVLLKPKGADEKNKKTWPAMPEATVRLIINYKKTQKTILRVSPRVPLEDLMPAVCEKCEFDQKTSILLRDVRSEEPLDLTKSLNDYGLREVYARDTKSVYSTDLPASPVHEEDKSTPGKGKTLKEKENKGLFSMFRKSKKKPDQVVTASAPTSPVSNKPRPASMPPLSANASVYSSNTMPSDVPKKRRAPLPPMMVVQSLPSNHNENQTNSPTKAPSEGDQEVSGISRGSSAESSLKRTKRKAPQPPSSPPSVATQDEAVEDRSIKAVDPGHTTLEEISEQEEMVVSMSVDSSSPTNIQEENESLDMPTNAPPDSEKMEMAPLPADAEVPRSSSPSPPTPLPPDGTGEDQSNDLSSHGKPAKDPVNDQESTEQTVSSVESPEPEHKVSAGSDLSQPVEQTGVLEESASALDENKENNNTGMCPTPEIPAPSAPSPKPLTQDAETHTSDPQSSEASDPQSSEAPEAQKGMAEKAASDGVASTVEDVPAQPNHQPPEHQKAASFSEPPKLRRDMATSTEELPLFEAPPPLPQASKSPPIYVLDSAPKPKPSNELTREYIPKVGLTTYTIVPQKSLEKLRYFEVELTLEAPDPAAQQEAAAKATNTEHSRIAVTATQPELLSPQPRAVPQLSNGMVTSNDACHGNLPPALPATLLADREDSKALTPYDAGIRAAPAPEAKEKKIPPATKPKPASFRLPLHKRTPGGYVTSAAVKSVNASHVSGHSEVPGRPGVEQPVETLEENSFPPPPPPVQWTEDEAAESSKDEQKPQEQSVADIHPLSLDSPPTSKLDCPVPSVIGPNPSVISPTESVLAPAPPVDGPTPRLTRQWSLPAKDSAGLSLEKLRSFAAPRPYMSTSQSRFAQAVSSALKRSQSLTQASGTEPQPRRTLPKPLLASHCTITEVVEPSRSSEREAQERQEGKAQALQREEQPDCGADSGTHSKTPSASDQGEIQDIYGDDTDHHVTGETDLPTVPEAFPPLSLNGGPSEMQSAQVE